MIGRFVSSVVIVSIVLAGVAVGQEKGTAEEAVAMTKRAVAYVRQNGPEKAFAAITAKDPAFIDRDLYVIAYDMQGRCLAHGFNSKLVGKELIDVQDTDGVFYVKNRIESAKTQNSFWQDYKFTNPTTKKIEPKSTYCEKVDKNIICVGIYKN